MIKKSFQTVCLLIMLSILISSVAYAFIYETKTQTVTQTILRKWLSGWDNRVRLTIDHNDVTSSLSDFPVLVYLSSSSGIDGDDVTFIFNEVGSNSKKIAVTTSDAKTQCYVEIEKWDYASNKAWFWAKVPSISNTVDTVLYLYYDGSHADNTAYVGDTGSTPAQNVWDSNYKGVWHLKETGTGVSGEYKDSTSNADNGTLTGTSVLNASYSMTASGNSYRYEDLTSVTDYTIVSDDTLEYDVYWTSSTDQIAVDYTCSDGTALRGSANDQNGLASHPAADLSSYALNKWYHRKIVLPAGHAGKTIIYADVACEYDGTAIKTAYLANIVIKRGGGIVKKIYSSGDSFTHALHIQSNGAVNSFGNSLDPASSSSTGKVGDALNSDGVRYVNMASSPTNAQNNWTLEAWVNPSILSQHGYVVYSGNDAGGYGFGMGNAAGDLGSKLTGLYGSVVYIDSGYTFPSSGTWYHVVMRRASGTVYFYVNGIQTPGTSASTPNTPNNYFTIGNELDSSNNPYRYFNGVIDEVRISNAANSPAWINASYEAERDHFVRWDSPWTPSGWHYRKSHIINSASGAGTNYQVKIKAYYGSGTDSGESVYLNFHSRTDFGDVRFTKDDGTTLLDYWIESKVDGDNAVFWVEVTDDLSNASRVIYLYYGKSDATTTGSGSSTFILFDDFNGPSLDGTKWTQKNGGILTFAYSQMTAPANNVDPAKIIATGGPTDNNRALRARFKVTGGTDADERVGLGVKTGTADGKGYNYVFRDFTNLDERSFLDDGVVWNVRTSSWLKSTWYVEEVYHDGTNIKGRFDDGSWQSQAWSERTGYLALNIGSKDSVTVWDWALIRKIVSPEPSHGSWGSEETF